jgi:hypothetical protein
MVHAAPIVEDTFTVDGTGTSVLNGRTPAPTNLPGTTFVAALRNSQQAPIIDADADSAGLSASGAANVSIASAGSYVKPTTFTISADLTINSIAFGTNTTQRDVRGIGLGFYNATINDANSIDLPSNNTTGGLAFGGVILQPNGDLRFRQAGEGVNTSTLLASYATEAQPTLGAFSTGNTYALSYTVDTSTGDISAVQLALGANSVTFDPTTTLFTDANTARAGFYGSGGVGIPSASTYGRVDNFAVTNAVPEPGMLATLAIGSANLLARRRRA